MLRPPALALALLLAGIAPAWPQETGGDAPDPAEWVVTGVDGGATVNLRRGPSTGEDVVAELSKGMVLRNLGCTGEGEARWCQVALGEGGVAGWASARYLAPHATASEAPAPSDAGVAPDPAAGDEAAAAPAPGPAAGDAMPPAPAGTVPCSLRGEPAQSCAAMKRQGEGGGIEIIVTFADGFERILDIGDGEGDSGGTQVYSPDPTDEVTATRVEGRTVVEINGVERIELPDALLGQ